VKYLAWLRLVGKDMNNIADMITIIRNGYLARKQSVELPNSKMKNEIAKKLNQLGFLESVDVKGRTLKLGLRYENDQPAIRSIKTISKPSLRVYTSAEAMPRILRGLGEVVVSTPKGILAGYEAKKAKVGGELILKVW
jgi:small subunit ribosomal protein S8